MVSLLKRSLAAVAGFGNPELLPPLEELSNECTGCMNPCNEHKAYPSYLNIEMDFPMLGSVHPYARHVIIATGVSDWPRKIEHEKGTFAYHLYRAESKYRTHAWKNLITNSSLTSNYTTEPGACDVLIFPDNMIVSNVTAEKADDFYNIFLSAPSEPVDIDLVMKDDRLDGMQVHQCPYKNVLLLCSHRKRDKRCGITAPILAQEFDHVLREKDLSEQDAIVLMVSHIGGHQLSGNVICYINNGTRGIWYGRVKTCHCLAIIEETVIKKKVIKDLYRGAMDNSFENQVTRSFLGW